MKIKVLGISGSPRRNGNTTILVQAALRGAEEKGAETEYITLADKKIAFCTSCRKCKQMDKPRCILEDDMEEIYESLLQADAIILGTPVYWGDMSAQLKALLDRCLALESRAHELKRGTPLRLKVGGAIAVAGARHGGQEHALQSIRYFFNHNEMIPIGLTSPHTQLGATGIAVTRAHLAPGDVREDNWYLENIGRKTSSLEMARMLGEKIVIVTKIIKAGVQATGLDVPKPYGSDMSRITPEF